jgi:hypothetical protein
MFKEPWEKKVEMICWLYLIMATIYFTPIIVRAFCK